MRAAFNDYEGAQGLDEAYKAGLLEKKADLSDLEFEQSKSPTANGASDVLILENKIRLAQTKYDAAVAETEAARIKYEAAGDAYLGADGKRLAAQEVDVAA